MVIFAEFISNQHSISNNLEAALLEQSDNYRSLTVIVAEFTSFCKMTLCARNIDS